MVISYRYTSTINCMYIFVIRRLSLVFPCCPWIQAWCYQANCFNTQGCPLLAPTPPWQSVGNYWALSCLQILMLGLGKRESTLAVMRILAWYDTYKRTFTTGSFDSSLYLIHRGLCLRREALRCEFLGQITNCCSRGLQINLVYSFIFEHTRGQAI